MPGRQILDYVILAHESSYFFKNKRAGKEGYMTPKLDMSKAYNKVEWHYLEAIMLKLGFRNRWVNWVMSYESSVSYAFNINGKKLGTSTLKEGLDKVTPCHPTFFFYNILVD